MFPLRWNFPFRKKDGTMSTVDEALGGGTYELPPATDESLGGIMVGDGLSIDEDGVLNVIASGGGHCYYVTTNISTLGIMIIFTAYNGEINNADTLYEALRISSNNVNGMGFPYGEKIVSSGGELVMQIRADAGRISADVAQISNGLFVKNSRSWAKSDFTSVSSHKIW